MVTNTTVDIPLLVDVVEGLSARQKYFPARHCHYFYDEEGSRLFEEITRQPSYYLTACEEELLRQHAAAIMRFVSQGSPIRLVELGVGDGHKTLALLQACETTCPCEYVPTDICAPIADRAAQRVADRFSHSSVTATGLAAEHLAAIDWVGKQRRPPRTAVLFLGSNIGNFTASEMRRFLLRLRQSLQRREFLVLGTDQKAHAAKPVPVIEAAYRDVVTARFSLNLLKRMNEELGADFEPRQFFHHACYRNGRIETRLVSKRQQWVTVGGRSFGFASGEEYFIERSQKFGRFDVEYLARSTGFTVTQHIPCSRDWFLISLLRAV